MAASKNKKSAEDIEPVLQNNPQDITAGDAQQEPVKTLRLDYFLHEEDFYDANMRYMYSSAKVLIALGLCILLLFQLIWNLFVAQAPVSTKAIGMTVAAIAMPTVLFPLLLKNQSRKMIDRHVAWEKHQHLIFSAKGLTVTGKKTGHKYKWEDLYQIKENSKYFMFVFNNAIKYVLPKNRATAEEIIIIRNFIKNSSRKKRTHLLNK